jgi:Ca2+-binding RTX toxin-like protein
VRKTPLAAFVVTALVGALVLASGVALAATINGDNGPNKLTGTPRADLIRGYGGNDNITGGKGVDRIYAGAGNDYVSSAGDGSRELVKCGPGIDTVDKMPRPGDMRDNFVGCERALL